MKHLLLILLLFPAFISAQHTKEEATEIVEVFHLTDLINDNGLAYLTGEVTERGVLTRLIPTKGRMENNPTGEIYAAQLINILGEVYSYETIYRGGQSIWLQMYRKAGISDSRKITADQEEGMTQEWRKQMANHPGHLLELALGENVLDTLQMKSKRLGVIYGGSFPVDWENYQMMVPPTTSMYEKTSPEILNLLSSLELITEEMYQRWKKDMDTNGYFSPAYILRELANEMGEIETKEVRVQANADLLKKLVTAQMITTENQHNIMRTDSLVASSEYGVFLPFLENIQRIGLPVECTMKEGYPALLNALAQIDSTLSGITFAIKQVKRPEGRDSTGEYFEIRLTGLGHSSKTVIHASKDSGDTPGKPPRLLYIPKHLKIVDDLLEKAGHEKRLYIASLWRQTSKDGILPTYVSLIDPANDRLVTMSYGVLGLSGARR